MVSGCDINLPRREIAVARPNIQTHTVVLGNQPETSKTLSNHVRLLDGCRFFPLPGSYPPQTSQKIGVWSSPTILQAPLKMMIETPKGRGEKGSEKSAVASTTTIHNGQM